MWNTVAWDKYTKVSENPVARTFRPEYLLFLRRKYQVFQKIWYIAMKLYGITIYPKLTINSSSFVTLADYVYVTIKKKKLFFLFC
jgi:hypothetical protein